MDEYDIHHCEVCGLSTTRHPPPWWSDALYWFLPPAWGKAVAVELTKKQELKLVMLGNWQSRNER